MHAPPQSPLRPLGQISCLTSFCTYLLLPFSNSDLLDSHKFQSHGECVCWVSMKSTKLPGAQEASLSTPPNNSKRSESQGDEKSKVKHRNETGT